MADESLSSFADLLLEMKGPLAINFPKNHVLLDELRRDTNPTHYSGSQVRVPVVLNPQQGGHGVSETGTINSPVVENTTQAHITMARNAFPVSFTPDLMYASRDNATAFAEASRFKMSQAELALARMENEQIQGPGKGLLVTCTGTGSTSIITLTTTGYSQYQFYTNRIVDILNTSTGTAETSGSSRSVVSTSATDSTITLDAAVTFTASDGVYTHGSYGQGLQSIQQIYATSGTFENISKTTVVGWQGTDGRGGDTTSADLSITLLDGAERRVKMLSGEGPDFYVGDPAVIDKYGQTLLTQSRWSGDKAQLATGWEGIQYRSKVLIPDFDHKAATVTGINKASLQMYAYNAGPEWDDLDGSIFKRISNRTLPVEAWLVDYTQLGAIRCNTCVFITNLNQAS